MKILIAEDDSVSCTVLQRMLTLWNHEVVVTEDGQQAWDILQQEDAPKLAILDWMMPEIDGVELCRRVKALHRPTPTYLILVTAKSQHEDVIFGLDAGADDFVSKPFRVKELAARIRVGERRVTIQEQLTQRILELEKAAAQINQITAPFGTATHHQKATTEVPQVAT